MINSGNERKIGKHAKENLDQGENHDHLDLAPPAPLKVVMNGSDLKESFSVCQLKIDDLQKAGKHQYRKL